MPDVSAPPQAFTLPVEASASLLNLLLRTYTDWEVGVGNGCAKDASGAPQRTKDGRLIPIAYDRSQVDLLGDSKQWRPCDPGYPVFNGGAILAKSTFQADEANFDHTEIGLRAKDPATGKKILLVRIPEDTGTKRGGLWYSEIQFVL